jgi:hypothetical protein
MLDRFGGHTDGTERDHYHFPVQDLQDHIHGAAHYERYLNAKMELKAKLNDIRK